jgi:hypothetical protein
MGADCTLVERPDVPSGERPVGGRQIREVSGT